MAVIKSGASTDEVTIDPTSKAMRVTPYDSFGNYQGVKHTYRASTIDPFVAAGSADLPIFNILGSSTKTIVVKRIVLSGSSLTAVAYLAYNLVRLSTASSGGVSVPAVLVPLDSASPAGTSAGVKYYTTAPTSGALVGTLASERALFQANTAAAAGTVHPPVVFSFGDMNDNKGAHLRGAAEELAVVFATAPASAVTLAAYVEWTEE